MRVARHLRRRLRRQLTVAGARLIVEITPEGTIACRGWYQRRWFRVQLAELFPHAIADAGGVPGDQLDLALTGLAREFDPTSEEPREGTDAAG